jgi:hypothetical protein
MDTMTALKRTNDGSGTFNRGRNAGTFTCTVCGTRRQLANMEATNVCTDCYDVAGIENEHQDGYHADQPAADCPMCKPKGRHVLTAAERGIGGRIAAQKRLAKAAREATTCRIAAPHALADCVAHS